MKQCYFCKKIKNLSEFGYSDKITNSDHHSSYCKECNRKRVKEWKKNNPNKVKEMKEKYKNSIAGKLWQQNYYKRYYLEVRKFKNSKYGIRFDVFKRDNFTCQYCGRKAPNIILELDHFIPKSKGGKDCLENYKTSCFECNRSKFNNILK